MISLLLGLIRYLFPIAKEKKIKIKITKLSYQWHFGDEMVFQYFNFKLEKLTIFSKIDFKYIFIHIHNLKHVF